MRGLVCGRCFTRCESFLCSQHLCCKMQCTLISLSFQLPFYALMICPCAYYIMYLVHVFMSIYFGCGMHLVGISRAHYLCTVWCEACNVNHFCALSIFRGNISVNDMSMCNNSRLNTSIHSWWWSIKFLCVASLPYVPRGIFEISASRSDSMSICYWKCLHVMSCPQFQLCSMHHLLSHVRAEATLSTPKRRTGHYLEDKCTSETVTITKKTLRRTFKIDVCLYVGATNWIDMGERNISSFQEQTRISRDKRRCSVCRIYASNMQLGDERDGGQMRVNWTLVMMTTLFFYFQIAQKEWKHWSMNIALCTHATKWRRAHLTR